MPITAAYDILSEGIKYVAVGLLGVLWWDIRKVRDMRSTIMKEQDDKIEKRLADNLTIDKHRDLCKIACLETAVVVQNALSEMKIAIVKEIRNGNQRTQ